MQLRFTQESDFRQERDFGQKISATFEFIGAHWQPLGRVLLYLVVPATLLQNVLAVVAQQQLHGAVRGAMEGRRPGIDGVLGMQGELWGTMLRSPVYWLNSLLGAAVFALVVLSVYGYLVLLLHRRQPGPAPTVAEVWAVVRQEFIGTYFSLWGVSLLVGIGMFLLFFPGLYLAVALSLFFIVKLSEGTGFGQTLRRCLHLTRGKWWSTFGVIFIMFLILYLVLIGFGVVATLLSGGVAAVVHASQEQSPLFTVAVTSGLSVVKLLLFPPLLLVLAFQYFNLVERKDGVGLRRMVETLGTTSAAPVASSAAFRPDEEGEY